MPLQWSVRLQQYPHRPQILAFFLNVARIGGLSGRLFDERQKSLLSVHHESVETIGAKKRRVNQMR